MRRLIFFIQMQLRGHLSELLLKFPLVIYVIVTTYHSFVAGNITDAAEFSMRKAVYDEINWYGSDCETLDQTREESERSFGNTDICPNNVRQGYDLSEHERSNCPWYYEMNHKSTRYPNNILISRTPCSACIGHDAD